VGTVEFSPCRQFKSAGIRTNSKETNNEYSNLDIVYPAIVHAKLAHITPGRTSPVADGLLREIYDLAKVGARQVPIRCPCAMVFVKSKSAKEKLMPGTDGKGNVEQVRVAPVTAIVAYDQKFYEQLPALFPAFDMRPMFVSNPAMSEQTAFSQQFFAGRVFHLLPSARLGLDAGPMSGFDNTKVDQALFRKVFLEVELHLQHWLRRRCKASPARAPRLSFDEVCENRIDGGEMKGI